MSRKPLPSASISSDAFAGLAALRDAAPVSSESAKQDARRPDIQTGPARAVVRLERKGRGGKEVTVVSHLALTERELEKWLKALKSGLGCGGQVEGELLVFQGDQRDRIGALLTARGVGRVTLG
jgi:translation initiation factor 1